MDKIVNADFSFFRENLPPHALACFRELFGHAKQSMEAEHEGNRKMLEVPLQQLMEAGGIPDAEGVAKTIQEILTCMVKVKKGEYLVMLPFFDSICIEDGLVRFSVPREVMGVLPTADID